jgi:signal transduction histidine kinase
MTIKADENQIRQVLINLFHNAADAIPQSGRIEIRAHLDDPSGKEQYKTPMKVITVADSGTGISAEAAEHLFEPFWTTKNEGTGLGLAISYRIIEEHGGLIKAESPPGGGCLITILLPD